MASLWEEKKIFNFFRGLEYLAHRFKWPFDKNSRNFFYPFLDPPRDVFGQKTGYRCELAWFFCSNILPALLIHSWKFHVDVLKGKKVCSEKPKHFWAKIGQNWPKSAIHIMQIFRARACKHARGLIFSPFYQNLMGVCRRNHQDPTNRWRSVEYHFPIVNANP